MWIFDKSFYKFYDAKYIVNIIIKYKKDPMQKNQNEAKFAKVSSSSHIQLMSKFQHKYVFNMHRHICVEVRVPPSNSALVKKCKRKYKDQSPY